MEEHLNGEDLAEEPMTKLEEVLIGILEGIEELTDVTASLDAKIDVLMSQYKHDADKKGRYDHRCY